MIGMLQLVVRVVLGLILLQLAIFFFGDHIPWLVEHQGIAALIVIAVAVMR